MAATERAVTAEDLRRRIEEIQGDERALARERYAAELELETMEGRPESHAAKFARAFLEGDQAAMDDECAEGISEHAAAYHVVPNEHLLRRAGFRVIVDTRPLPGAAVDAILSEENEG